MQQTQGIVADARAALRVSPELRFKWVLGGTKESFMAVWNSTERTDRLVAELAAFTHANSEVVHGITLDYEEHYNDNESAVKHGMTAFVPAKAQGGDGARDKLVGRQFSVQESRRTLICLLYTSPSPRDA